MADLTPVHPGEILKEDYLEPLGISAHRLAMELHLPASRISEIVNCRRSITAETALRLARFFDTSAAYWMNLQTQYDLAVAEDEDSEEVERDVRPLAMRA
jgi:addiction module HigA family antidote